MAYGPKMDYDWPGNMSSAAIEASAGVDAVIDAIVYPYEELKTNVGRIGMANMVQINKTIAEAIGHDGLPANRSQMRLFMIAQAKQWLARLEASAP